MKREVEGVSAEAMSLLMAHDWPGNVRELRNVLERGIVVAKSPVIQATDLGLASGASAGGPDRPASLSEIERRHIASVLQHSGGNVSQAARILDIDRVTLYNKIRKYHLRDAGEHEMIPEREKT
jgi:DNA-binding NtrC family response regulator